MDFDGHSLAKRRPGNDLEIAMCGLLVQAPHVLTIVGGVGVGIAGIGVAVLFFRLSEPNGVVGAIIGTGIGLLMISIFLHVLVTDAVDRSCGGPAAGKHRLDIALGYQGQPDAPRLISASVTKEFVTLEVEYVNGGNTPQRFDCPDAPSMNGVPSVDFEDLTSNAIAATDYYCRFSLQHVLIKPGQSFVAWAKFKSDWRFRRPFTFWWYGSTAKVQL
jgi:hypothetical protein